MRLYMELESKRGIKFETSPKTVIPSNGHWVRVQNGIPKQKPTCRKNLHVVEKVSRDNCFAIPSDHTVLEGNEMLKRGSVYQSSKSVRKMKELRAIGNMRNVKDLCQIGSDVSFRAVDPLCSLDEEDEDAGEKKLQTSNINKVKTAVSSDGFFEIIFDLDRGDSAETIDIVSVERPKCKYDEAAGLTKGSDNSLEKSLLSSKLHMDRSQSPSGSDRSRDSPGPRFRSAHKMFDLFSESNSSRSSESSTADQPGDATPTCMANRRMNKMFRKSLLNDFSNTEPTSPSHASSSPAHLLGSLLLENRHGMPYFKFSVKCPEDAFVAKTWKAPGSFNWSYTFHSIRHKKNSSRHRGLKDGNKDSSLVGQMQVLCYLNPEKGGSSVTLNNSLVMEFVVHDIANARKKLNAEGSFNQTAGLHNVLDSSRLEVQQNNTDLNCSAPWAQAALHPQLEDAAIVVEVPFEKTQRVKCKGGNKIIDGTIPALLDPFLFELRENCPASGVGSMKVKVITPTGHHGLPSTSSQGPSSLLDRWRLGGSCDCGGWDMGCPLMVFGDLSAETCFLAENEQPFQLFIQGAKEKTPALTMELVEEGHYAVDFHAQLSSLQAFSICVAMLHGAEASTIVGQERSRQELQNNPLRPLMEEEVKSLIEATMKKTMIKGVKEMHGAPAFFIGNPPFSPISRV